MYGFCTTMNVCGSSPFPASSCFVNRTFSPVFVDLFSTRMRSFGTPISIAMRGELIRFRLVPQVPRDRAEAAGEDQQRRPPLQEELGAARRDDLVVAAEDQNRVRMRQLMIEVMVVPDFLDEGAYPIVHQRARPHPTVVGLLETHLPIRPLSYATFVAFLARLQTGFCPARNRSTRPARSFRYAASPPATSVVK